MSVFDHFMELALKGLKLLHKIDSFHNTLTFKEFITVSWCLRTASAENSEFAIKHRLSKARYLNK